MNLRPFLIRPLVTLVGLCAMAGWASVASAQTPDPLAGCKDPSVRYHRGPTFDEATSTWTISVGVIVECDGTQIFAEEIRFNDKTIFASGNLLVVQNGLRVNADRMEMDRQTHLGTFYHAHGTARLTDGMADKSMFGTMEAEMWFDAERIERLGPRRYKLTNGVFSTCVQPNARWEMRATSGTVVLDEHAVMKNMQFRVKGVPVLYFPYFYYPLKKEDRATGFLIPVYSASGVRGQGISTAFFWAINRSQDATLNYDYFSKSGQGFAGDYRYVSAPNYGGTTRLYVLDEKERLNADGTVERTAHQSYKFTGDINQPLGRRFQVIGHANYFNDITTTALYQQDVAAFSNRQRNLSLTLTGQLKYLRINALIDRNEIFTGDVSSLQQSTPRVHLWLNSRSIRGKIYYSANGEAVWLQTRPQEGSLEPDKSVRWFDATTTASAPLSKLSFLDVTTSAVWRLTTWLDSLDPVTGLAVPVPITRNLFTARADMSGPRLARVFLTPSNGYAEKFKHEIVPQVSVIWLSPFDRQAELIHISQGVDGVVSGTTTINYSLANLISARQRTPDGKGRVRSEFLTVTLGQSYYTNAQAGTVDPRYPTGATGNFSPLQILARLRPTDGLYFNFQTFKNSIAWATAGTPAPKVQYSGTASVELNRLRLTGGWSKSEYYTKAQGFVDLTDTHALNASATVKTTDNRMGATYGFYFDVKAKELIQQRITVHYHAQCCGIAADYQTVSSALSTVPIDRRFAITFTLAGIGSFAPPLGGFGR